jgi:hypothetical protein
MNLEAAAAVSESGFQAAPTGIQALSSGPKSRKITSFREGPVTDRLTDAGHLLEVEIFRSGVSLSDPKEDYAATLLGFRPGHAYPHRTLLRNKIALLLLRPQVSQESHAWRSLVADCVPLP